jgi:hypothetical protein
MTITRMAMMAWVAGTVAYASQPQLTVTVYLRDRANAPSRVRIPAKAMAAKMFAKIGIRLEWRIGEPTGASLQPPVIIDLLTDTPQNCQPGALAYAMPYEGTHIAVFFDRLEQEPNAGTVLAHVMVHEISHLLQGISRHSATGLMKARWSVGDFGDMKFKPLAFAAMDVELIRSGLSKRTERIVAPVAKRQ